MISTVTVQRMMSCDCLVEHPEGWTEEQVRAALTARAMDFGARVQMWDAESKTTLGAIALGEDNVSEEPDEEGAVPYQPDPFELTDDDQATE